MKVNDGHGLECLHMTYVLRDMLHTYVEDTLWVGTHPELREAIDNASDALGVLYQEIGKSMPDVK